MFEVCCVGHMCADVLAKPVDRLPDKGKLELLEQLQLKTGGCAMNTAVVLGKLGVNTALVGKAGDDGFGRFLTETLIKHNVNTDGLRLDRNSSTSGSVVAIGMDGERTILHYLGSNSSLCFEDIDLSIVECSRILFVGGTFILPRFDGADCARLLKFAREKNVTTALDTAWDATGQWMEKIRCCLPYLDYFLPSYEEAVQLSGETEYEKIAENFHNLGVKNVTVKLGGKGCYVKPEGHDGFYAAPYAVTVVDTSGAGDAFCAGFLAGLSHGMDLGDCAKLGNAAGALCVTAVGTTEGIRDFEQLQEFAAMGLDKTEMA